MPKITPKNKSPGRSTERQTITAKTTDKVKLPIAAYQWWNAQNDEDLAFQTISSANYLQKTQQYRIRGASIFSRIYSGKGLMNYALNSKVLDTSNQLPVRRPTMNVTQSCTDTLVSRISQNQPRPMYLTEGGNYRQRKLAETLDQFIAGELYRTKAYHKGTMALRDACVFGDGFIKVFEENKKVALQRVLTTELFADKDDSWNGDPRQFVQFSLSDRGVVAANWPDAKLKISKANKAYVDGSGESSETISDQIILVEAWHRRSSEDSKDGRHVIVCSDGVILDESWDKDYFPFVKMAYNPHSVGYFSQGIVEMLMGTQLGIDTILRTISEAMNVVGVPRVFISELSKILETSINNNVGSIIKYRGDMPTYHTANSNAPDVYEHLMRLIQFAYQIAGISQLTASGVKPAGLNSGEAQREYLQTQDERFASLDNRYTNMYNELAVQITDVASDIVKRDGKYSTVYPGKDGLCELDFPKLVELKDTFTIQCYDESSLPRDPAGRQAKLSEMLASGEITIQVYQRLSTFPDIAANDKLANALQNRIIKILDDCVFDGKDPIVDAFLLDPTDLATVTAVQYVNYYATQKLEEKRMQLLRDFITHIGTLKQQALPPPPMIPQGQPAQQQNPNQAPPPSPPPTPQSAVSQAA
jgi:hypothetical protein